MEKKRLTVVSHMSELYGAPRSLLPIIDILSEKFELHVVTFGDKGMPQELDKKGIPYTVIPLVKYDRKKFISRVKRKIQNYFGDYYFTGMVKKVLRELKPDLVYVNTVSRGAPILAADSLGLPVIVHVRESVLYFNKDKAIDRRRIKAVINIPKCYFTVSESTRQMIIDQGADGDRVHCVHSGINLEPFTPDKSERSDKTFGFVGNMTARKGVKNYVEISRKLISEDNSLESLIVGGDLKSNTYKQLQDSIPDSLKNSFIFTGKVSSVKEYYNKMSIFCLTSSEEPFARVLIEAMAAELPVIAFDTGGVTELVEDGINGFVIENGDNDSYAEKLGLLMADKDLRLSMGQKGRAKVYGNFKLEDYMNRIHDIIIPKIESHAL